MIELDSGDVEFQRYRGWLLWFSGHPDEAWPHLHRALTRKPDPHRAALEAGGAWTTVTQTHGRGDYWGYFFLGNAGRRDAAIRQRQRFRGQHDDDRFVSKWPMSSYCLWDEDRRDAEAGWSNI